MTTLYYSDVLMPRKACAFARHVGADIDYRYLDLGKGEHKAPDYLAINPNGKVPTLVEHDRTLWEANAIMALLARRLAPDYLPLDDRLIEVQRWLSWDSQHFTRHGGSLYFEHVIRAKFGMGEPDADAVAEATGHFRTHAAVLDGHLDGRQWLVGDAPTIADFAVAVTLPYAAQAHIPVEDYPAVSRWHERMMALDGWSDPFPARVAEPA